MAHHYIIYKEEARLCACLRNLLSMEILVMAGAGPGISITGTLLDDIVGFFKLADGHLKPFI
jgi:hypothetical protein